MDFKLMNGDCLDCMNEILDRSVDMVLCDPPYGTTQCKWDSVIDLNAMWAQLKRVTKINGAIVMTAAQPFTTTLIASNMKDFKYCWVWEKSQAVGHLNAWKQPMRKTEDVCVFYRKQSTYNPMLKDKPIENQRPQTARTKGTDNYGNHGLTKYKCPPDKSMPSTVIRFNNAQRTVHPTQKPVALMEYLIKTYTDENETILDFTMGSGSTGVAAINTNRRFIGIEKDPKYYQIAEGRIGQAVLDAVVPCS